MRLWIRERAIEQLKKEGRTKEWLAEYCGIDLPRLNHYLSGRRNPPRPIVKLISQALNTTESYLYGEEDTVFHPVGVTAATR